MPGTLADLFLPLRRIGDVRGRSTRSELVRWLLLAMALTVVADFVTAASAARAQAQLCASLLLLTPTVPLVIRRAHDVGWSGWWLLLGVPALAFNLSILGERVTGISPDPQGGTVLFPAGILPVFIGLLIGVVVLLFWDDQKGANRFGPNPRDGAAPLA